MVTELPADPNTKNVHDYRYSPDSDAPAPSFLHEGEPFQVIGHVILSSRTSQIIQSHSRQTFTLESTEHEKKEGQKGSAPRPVSTNGHEELASSQSKDKSGVNARLLSPSE